jgi:hypothetical protein
MKYIVYLFFIALSQQVLSVGSSDTKAGSNSITINSQKQKQSSTLADSKGVKDLKPSSNNLASDSKNKKRKNKDRINLLIFMDSDYQEAIDVLYDQNNARIYDDYLRNISRSFINYYLAHLADSQAGSVSSATK